MAGQYFFSSYDMFCAVLLTSSEYWQSRALNYRCNYSLRDSLMTWRQKIVAQKKEVKKLQNSLIDYFNFKKKAFLVFGWCMYVRSVVLEHTEHLLHVHGLKEEKLEKKD